MTFSADPSIELFHGALELSVSERSRFLDERCGEDADLRRTVEELLLADAEVEASFLERVAPRLDGLYLPPGTRIGHYRIGERIGEGGMGTVYTAQQAAPRRDVALKVIRPDRLSPGALRRFQHEAEILGTLQHSGIAQVFEAGSAEVQLPDGSRFEQPYLVMELVRGVPLLEFVRSHGLNFSQRIELLARVSDAVQHAHQRGVIHRDLKPANVLVVDEETVDGSEAVDGTRPRAASALVGQPKILDFGVARFVDGSEGSTARETQAGDLLGTLSYMSPEQIDGGAAGVDVRSDVYALGVMLYELASDRLPFDLKGMSLAKAIDHISRGSRRPLKSVAKVHEDVSVMASKALEVDADRRYQSAGDLALDLRRHLAGEPISARGDSSLYLLTLGIRRHRRWLTVATLVTLLSVAFSIFATMQSRENLVLAEAEHDARQSADANLRNALLAVDVLTAVAQEELREVPRAADSRKRLLEAALEFQRSLTVDQPSGHPQGQELLGRTAMARARVGQLLAELGLFEEAVTELRGAILDLETNDREDLGLERARIESLLQLGRILVRRGSLGEAARIIDQMVAIAPRMEEVEAPWAKILLAGIYQLRADVEQDEGHLALAQASLGEARTQLDQLLLTDAGNRQGRWQLAKLLLRLGVLLRERRLLLEAPPVLQRSSALAEELYHDDPRDPEYRHHLLVIETNLARIESIAGNEAEAVAGLRKAVAKGEELLEDFPRTVDYRESVTWAYHQLAVQHLEAGEFLSAVNSFERGFELLAELISADPESADYRYQSAMLHGNYASTLLMLERDERAREGYTRALEEVDAALARKPHDLAFARARRKVQINLARIDAEQFRYEKAAAAVRGLGNSGDPAEVILVVAILDQVILSVLEDDDLAASRQDFLVQSYLADALLFLERSFAERPFDLEPYRQPTDLAVLPFLPEFEGLLNRLAE